jgi:hypothetical protein
VQQIRSTGKTELFINEIFAYAPGQYQLLLSPGALLSNSANTASMPAIARPMDVVQPKDSGFHSFLERR